MRTTLRRRVMLLKWGFLLLLLSVPARLVQLQLSERSTLNGHPYNLRLAEDLALRGSIVDSRGQPLALSRGGRRTYPQGALAAHWSGYYHPDYGRTGAEAWKHELLRERRHVDAASSSRGHTLRLSLDLGLQARVGEALGARPGAAVVVDLESGQVLAGVSRPDFDPRRAGADVRHWVQDAQSPTLNRFGLGLYPAGSLWKAWEPQFRALPSRPALVMDWTLPQRVQGQWLVSPLNVATVVLRSGSSLSLSQLYSAHRQPWNPAPWLQNLFWRGVGSKQGQLQVWSGLGRLDRQVVAWALVRQGAHLVVVALEECQQPAEAVVVARASLP